MSMRYLINFKKILFGLGVLLLLSVISAWTLKIPAAQTKSSTQTKSTTQTQTKKTQKKPKVQTTGKVHTIYWKASLRRSIKVGGMMIKSGTSVVVINRSYNSRRKSTVRYKDKTFSISNSCLSYKCDLASAESKGDYSRQIKESYINRLKKRQARLPGWSG